MTRHQPHTTLVSRHVLLRCDALASSLEAEGGGGDAHDVRELLGYVTKLTTSRHTLVQRLYGLREQLAAALVKPQVMIAPEVLRRAVQGGYQQNLLSTEEAAYMLGMCVSDFLRLAWVACHNQELRDGISARLDR